MYPGRKVKEMNISDINALTPEVLASIPDTELDAVVYEFAWRQFEHDWQEHVSLLSNSPIGFRVIYYSTILEVEVNNGGFDQYFFNSRESGESPEMAVEALEFVGAKQHLRLLQNAMAIWFEQEYMQGVPLEGYTYQTLKECDEAFYSLDSLSENLYKLRIRFIRGNPELFIGS
jgi:hypothetical protein